MDSLDPPEDMSVAEAIRLEYERRRVEEVRVFFGPNLEHNLVVDRQLLMEQSDVLRPMLEDGRSVLDQPPLCLRQSKPAAFATIIERLEGRYTPIQDVARLMEAISAYVLAHELMMRVIQNQIMDEIQSIGLEITNPVTLLNHEDLIREPDDFPPRSFSIDAIVLRWVARPDLLISLSTGQMSPQGAMLCRGPTTAHKANVMQKYFHLQVQWAARRHDRAWMIAAHPSKHTGCIYHVRVQGETCSRGPQGCGGRLIG